MFPKNDRQAQLLNTANNLAKEFEKTAAEHDRNGTFPFDNYVMLENTGYTSAAIPTEEGGGGHTLTDIVLAQLALAKGDGSTALGIGMHLVTTGTETYNKSWPKELRKKVFSDVVQHGTLINSLAAEPMMGSPRTGGQPETSLVPKGDGVWELNGRKIFSTLAPLLTYFIIYCTVDDGSGDVARVIIDKDRSGVKIDPTWDSIGMRSTGSHDIVFENVIVKKEDFISQRSLAENTTAMSSGGAWLPLLIGAANLGIAESSRDYIVEYVRNRNPGGKAFLKDIPYIREQIGRVDTKLIVARNTLLNSAQDWDDYPDERENLQSHIYAAKLQATNTAIEIVDICMRVAGGEALYKSLPLERHFRDVRGGIVNPPIEARALEFIAKLALE